jgi:hypothetical protein
MPEGSGRKCLGALIADTSILKPFFCKKTVIIYFFLVGGYLYRYLSLMIRTALPGRGGGPVRGGN